jgi:hypothetical protein
MASRLLLKSVDDGKINVNPHNIVKLYIPMAPTKLTQFEPLSEP